MTQPSASSTPGENPRLNAILAEYLKRKDAGTPIDRQAMLQAYPDLADGLRSYFQAEAMMGGMAVAETVRPKTPVPQPPANVRETVRPKAAHSDTASEFHSRSFGRYELLRPLGEGAMGSVFLAQDTTLDRQVALKIPKTDGKSNVDFMARFSREAKAAAGLKHPNICSVYDAGEHDGTPFITMDFIDGVPLSRFIGSRQLTSVDSVLQMVATIAEAVGHAHSKGVIHRDLKPGNILVDAEFRPIVTDFGLARRAGPSNESRLTQEGLLIGTPAYMAPEQVKGEQAKVGPRSDIYSLGVMLFEMLTSRLPFEGVEGSIPDMLAQILRDHPPAPGKFRKDLSEDVNDLCVKMLKKDPDKRFNSMPDVVTAIGQLRAKLKRAPVNQADVARQQSPFEIQKSHIEQMLKKGQYAAAIQDLEKLAKETLPGAKAVAEWARKTLPGVRAEAKALNPAGLAALLQTAREMFEKHDYPGCIQLLDDIPALRRTEAIEDLLERAQSREAEAEQLLSDIKERERNQHLDGIEVLVKRLLKLKPGNSYAKRLWEALQTYSKTPATRRTYRYAKGRLQPMPEFSFLRHYWALLGSLVAVLFFLSGYYYFTIICIKSDTQILAVYVDDEWLKAQGGELTLLVDGISHTISTDSLEGEEFNVIVTLGNNTFSVKNGDTVVHDPETFSIQKDDRRILYITSGDMAIDYTHPIPVPVPRPPTPAPSVTQTLSVHVDGAWLKEQSEEMTLVVDGKSHSISEKSRTGEEVSFAVTLGQHTFSTKHGDTELNNPEIFTIQNDDRKFLYIARGGIELVSTQVLVKNQLKRIGLALHNYHDTHGTFPPTNESPPTKLADFTWRVLSLPYLEQASTYNQINFTESWDSPNNKAILAALPEPFDSPTLSNDQRKKGLTIFLAPVAEGTVLGHKMGCSFLEITDGTSNTILLVAAHPTAAKIWSSPGELPIDMSNPLKDLKGQPGGEFAVLMCDGSVKMLPDTIDPEVFRRLLVKNDGKEIDWDKLQSAPEKEPESFRESIMSTAAGIVLKLVPATANPYYIGIHEVTQLQYVTVSGKNPSEFQDQPGAQQRKNVAGVNTENFPVESVGWVDAVEFCNALSLREQLPAYYLIENGVIEIKGGAGYRLPTYAEWQNAVNSTRVTTEQFHDFCWHSGNAGGRTHQVGTKKPNELGLFDLFGNVGELCWTTEGKTKSQADGNFIPGGSWVHSASECIGGVTVWPNFKAHDVGFRVARDAVRSENIHVDLNDTNESHKPLDKQSAISPNSTDTIAILPAPIQLSPKDGTLLGNRPQKNIMKWKPVPGATLYRVQIQFFIGPNGELGPACDFEAKTNQFENDLNGNRPKRWRVGTASGPTTAWSDWWEFRYRP